MEQKEEIKATIARNGVIVTKNDKETEIVRRPDGHISVQISRNTEDGDSLKNPTCIFEIRDNKTITATALSTEGAEMLCIGLMKYLEFLEDFERNATK